jgi:hypothetical protein
VVPTNSRNSGTSAALVSTTETSGGGAGGAFFCSPQANKSKQKQLVITMVLNFMVPSQQSRTISRYQIALARIKSSDVTALN